MMYPTLVWIGEAARSSCDEKLRLRLLGFTLYRARKRRMWLCRNIYIALQGCLALCLLTSFAADAQVTTSKYNLCKTPGLATKVRLWRP